MDLANLIENQRSGPVPQNGLGLDWAGLGLGLGLQAVSKQWGWSFLHPAAAARGCGQRAAGSGAAANHADRPRFFPVADGGCAGLAALAFALAGDPVVV